MICIVFLLSVLGLASLAQAATYYVSKSSNGNNVCGNATTGTNANAMSTINLGIGCMASGDTLIVGPGTYDEILTDLAGQGGYTVPIPSGGGEGSRTIIRAENPLTTTLIVTNPPPDWKWIVLLDTHSYITLDGFILDGQFQIDVAIGMIGHHHRYANLEIKNMREQGIQGSGDDHEFLNIHMHHIALNYAGQNVCPSSTCGEPGLCENRCHAMYYGGSGTIVYRALLDGGSFHDIESHAMHWYSTNGTIRNVHINRVGAGIGLYGGGTGNHIYNNVIANYRGEAIKYGGGNTQTIIHNTICNKVAAGNYVIQQGGSSTPSTIKNNLILQGPASFERGYIYIEGGVGPSGNLLADGTFAEVAGNLCDDNTMLGCGIIAASPSPVIDCAGDLHLVSGSSAIGQSPSQGGTYGLDKDGNVRATSGSVDTGAYVFAAAAGPVATSLNFVTQPTTTVVGTTITPAVQVEILDQNSARLTSSTLPVTLALAANPNGADLTGVLQVNAVSGLATFPNLQVTVVGNNYSIRATHPALTDGTSNAFNVLPPPPATGPAAVSLGHFLVR